MAESLTALLGGQPMTPTDLVREISKAEWPATVNVAPADFFNLVLAMGLAPVSFRNRRMLVGYWSAPAQST